MLIGNGEATSESGQSIVLVALVFVILLLFVGIALDVGFGFVRSSQFSRSVDSAALAGVPDLDISLADCTSDPLAMTCPANIRAAQFLAGNGWPISESTSFDSSWSFTQFGIPEYSITVTYPVRTYFMRLLNITDFQVTHSASAAYYALTDLLVPTALTYSQIRQASQFLTGPNGCSETGDPVVPLYSTNSGGTKLPNTDYSSFDGLYRYRIRIPPSYPTSTVQVELFDPDSFNNNSVTNFNIIHSNAYSNTYDKKTTSASCTGQWGVPCILETGEDDVAAGFNPLWFQRVDENFSVSCAADPNNATGSTRTVFKLYTIDESGKRTDVAAYTALPAQAAASDLKWVVPGVTPGITATVGVGIQSFQVPVSLLPGASTDPRFLYLDVYADTGSSRNVWDINAGAPPSFFQSYGLTPLPSNVNDRNLLMANNPGVYDSLGVTVAAIGRMPVDNHLGVSDPSKSITMRLSSVGELTTQAYAYVNVFDEDQSTNPRNSVFSIDSDLSGNLGVVDGWIGDPASPDGNDQVAKCNGTPNCNALWTDPNWILKLPNDPTLGFGGGEIVAELVPKGDAFTWSLAITAGRPFLTR